MFDVRYGTICDDVQHLFTDLPVDFMSWCTAEDFYKDGWCNRFTAVIDTGTLSYEMQDAFYDAQRVQGFDYKWDLATLYPDMCDRITKAKVTKCLDYLGETYWPMVVKAYLARKYNFNYAESCDFLENWLFAAEYDVDDMLPKLWHGKESRVVWNIGYFDQQPE